MKTKGMLGRKGVLLMMIMAMITIMGSCEYYPSNIVDDSHNIEYEKIIPTWTQEEAAIKVSLALTELSTQSQTLINQYADWEAQLRSEIKGNNDYRKIKQLNFAQAIQDTETYLSNIYQWSYVVSIKRFAGNYFIDLAEAICELIEDQNDEALFMALAEAFFMAHYINQREYYTSEADKISKQAEFTVLKERVEQQGGFEIPQYISGAISKLRYELRKSLPVDCGEHRNSFIQQYEDYSQFDAWTDDLQILGYSLTNIPRS